MINAELKAIKMQEDKDILAAQVEQLTQELNMAQQEVDRTISIYKKEMEIQQLQHFQVIILLFVAFLQGLLYG